MDDSTFLLAYFSALVFLVGGCVGSFLNVCIYRIPREESVVTPRSHCPHCGAMIAWYDNFPFFSYVFLRARCRKCGGVISARYFLVEMLTAVLFLLVWLKYGFDLRTPVYWMVVSGLILGTFVDFEHMIIPDRVTLGGVIAGLVLSPLIPSLQGETAALRALGQAAFSAALGAGILWGVGMVGKWVLKKDAMGMGDVKLLGGVGALLGWRAVLFTIMISAVIGTVVGVGLILTRRKEWQSRIPYGPYLSIAAVLWILWGALWWDLYMAWMGGGAY